MGSRIKTAPLSIGRKRKVLNADILRGCKTYGHETGW